MLRFGNLIISQKNSHINLDIAEIYPVPILRNIFPVGKLRKWAAYIDKFYLFPQTLQRVFLSRQDPITLIHIIDHSNAIYLPKIKRKNRVKKIITCHDLIAIRSARGDFAQAPQTSNSGKRLQNWISASLNHADFYVCDSKQTLKDLNRLIPLSKAKSSIFHLGTEVDSFINSDRDTVLKELPFDPDNTNFFLHVGSSAWYKNRKAVLRSFVHTQTSLPNHNLKLVLVGPEPQKEELDDHLMNWIKSNPNAIHALQKISEDTLSELYKYAQALVFPSFIEGFGWPPLEAAIRRCPVITTNTGAIEDLLGSYPIYVNSDNQASIDKGVMKSLQLCRSNQSAITLPNHEDCIRQYFDLYERMITN